MALDETIIEFLSPINVAKNIYIDGRSLGANAFTSTTIPTNNNQLVNGEGYITAASLQGVPAILSNGVIPSLNSGITAAEVRSLIGAGTGGGSVTSVGLSMDGNAVGVNGSPITSSGTLDISWIGDSNQYVNGEGNLVEFPSIPQGDITQVVAQNGLIGGGSSGSVTVAVQYVGVNNIINEAAENNTEVDAKDLILYKNNNDDTVYSARVTDLITASGVITGVDAGTGMTGGGSTGNVQLNVIGGSGITANANDIAVDSTVVRTSGTQTIAGLKTFSNNVELANTADLKFVDLAGTFPTSGKGFDWTLNNDGARIYAIQPSSDSIDLTFELRDNATTNDRFVFHVNDYQGAAFDKYPLIIRGGTQFDLVDSSLYTDGTIRLSNTGALTNVTNTNWDSAYNNTINKLAVTGNTTKTLTATQVDGGTLTASWTDNSASVSNNKITLTPGTGMSGGGDFTLNQAVDETITLTNNDRGSSQAIFKTITASGGIEDIVAESNSDTLNFVGQGSISVTTDVKGRNVNINSRFQELLLEGTELTLSDGNSVELPTSTGPKGDQGIQGIQGTQGDIGLTGAKGNAGTNGAKGDQGVRGLQGIQGDIGLTGSKGAQGGTGAKGDQGIQGIQGGQGDIGLTGSKGAAGTNGTNGARGLTGLTGAAGTDGSVGKQGIQGLKGDTGSQGGTGSKGDQGIQGIQGGQGDIGLTGAKGSTGSQGGAGAKGDQGIQGKQGGQGDIGLTGSKGSTGSAGTNGTNGAKGDTGAAGGQGLKGDTGGQGIQGKQGGTGAKGDAGATGGQGIQGIRGVTGTAGTNGAAGAKGATGGQGIQGIQGLKGSTGTAGTNGAAGAKGDKGLTGNTGAKGNAGTNGTNGDKGATGDTGGQGIQGIRGVTGTAGSNGTNGIQGIRGLTGAGGSRGLQGTPGAAGSNGAKGDVGAQGGKGDQGATGNTGSQGIKGSTGSTGLQGTPGAAGAKGSTGSTGPTGGQGIQGIRGATGTAGTNGTNGSPGATGSKGATGSQGSTGSQGPRGFTGASGGSFPVTIDKNEPSNIKSMSVNTTSRNPFATVVLDNGTSFLLTVYSLMAEGPGK